MGRLWLALAMVVAVCGSAFAKRDPACTCMTDRVLPAAGAVDVPTNAKLWHVPVLSSREPFQRIASYELAPHTAFQLTSPAVSFTTGAGADDSPPTDPAVTYVSITLAGSARGDRLPVSILHVVAATSIDTAVVRVAFIDALGEQVYWTTPQGLSACDPGFSLLPGHARVAVSAYDIAGNESGTDVYDAEAATDPEYTPSCTHHVRCGTGYVGLFLLSPFVFAFIMIVVLVIVARFRARARLATVAEPIAIPAVEALARAVRLRAVLMIVTLAAMGTSATSNDDLLVLALFASPLLLVVAFVGVTRLVDAMRALDLLRYDGVTALVQRDQVAISVGNRRVILRASRWLVERSRRHALPRASL